MISTKNDLKEKCDGLLGSTFMWHHSNGSLTFIHLILNISQQQNA